MSVIGIIHGSPGAYGISFPDLPGCISAGDTLDGVLAASAEAVAFHVAGMAEDGDAIPVPRQLDALKADPRFADDFADAVLVAAVPFAPPGKAVRVNITLDEHLLAAVDRAAEAIGSSRSGFLADAARARLGVR